MKKKSVFSNKEYMDILLFVLLGLLPLLWFKSDFINGGDFGFPMASPWNILVDYMNIWLDKIGLGIVNSRAIAQLPFMFILSAVSKIGIPMQICERAVFVLTFGLSGLGMYYLIKVLPLDLNKRMAGIFAGLFSMFNTFNVVFYWHILDGMIYSYTILIVSAVFYLYWFKTQKSYFGIAFYLMTFIGSYMYCNPLIIPVQWCLLFGFSLLIFIDRKNGPEKLKIGKYVGFLVSSFLLWVLVSSFWLLPLVFSLREEYSGLQTSIGSTWDTLNAFSSKTSFLNLFRLNDLYWAFGSNYLGEPYYSYAKVYSTMFFRTIGLLIPVIMFFPLLIKKRPKILVYFAAFAVICLFAVKGSHSPFGGGFYKVISRIPLLPALRAPVHKLGVILLINYSILFGSGICLLYAWLKDKSKWFAVVIIGIVTILLLIIYPFPIWTGEVIHRGGEKYPSFHVKIPEYYSEVESALLKGKSDYRFASFPMTPTFNVVYKWEHGFIGSDPSFNLFSGEGIYSTVSDFGQLPYHLLRDYDRLDMYKLLRLQNVEYILLHKDINEEFWDTFTGKYKDVDYLSKRLMQQKEIQYVKTAGQIEIYKLDNNELLPRVFAAPELEYVFGDEKYLLTAPELTKYPAVTLSEQQHTVESLDNYFAASGDSRVLLHDSNLKDAAIDLITRSKSVPVSFNNNNDIEFSPAECCDYELWYRTKDDQSEPDKLDIYIDGRKVKAEHSAVSNSKWSELPSARLESGAHVLSAYLRGKPYVLKELVVVKKGVTDASKEQLGRMLAGKNARVAVAIDNLSGMLEPENTILFEHDTESDYDIVCQLARKPGQDIPLHNSSVFSVGKQTYNQSDLHIIKNSDGTLSGNIRLHVEEGQDKIIVKDKLAYFEIKPAKCQTRSGGDIPAFVSFIKTSPSKYKVKVNAIRKFVLVFNQSYHPKWIASVDGVPIPESGHFAVNGYANGYVIDRTGEYTVTIEYVSQKYFIIGLVISSLALIFVIVRIWI